MTLLRSLLVTLPLLLAACGEADETVSATIRNDFATAKFTLMKVAYRGVKWSGPIGMGAQSAAQPVKPGLESAYALAVWDYMPAASPAQLPLVIRTKAPVEAIAGTPVNVVFSEASHTGKCGGLPQAEYEQILAQQFPGETAQAYADIVCK